MSKESRKGGDCETPEAFYDKAGRMPSQTQKKYAAPRKKVKPLRALPVHTLSPPLPLLFFFPSRVGPTPSLFPSLSPRTVEMVHVRSPLASTDRTSAHLAIHVHTLLQLVVAAAAAAALASAAAVAVA